MVSRLLRVLLNREDTYEERNFRVSEPIFSTFRPHSPNWSSRDHATGLALCCDGLASDEVNNVRTKNVFFIAAVLIIGAVLVWAVGFHKTDSAAVKNATSSERTTSETSSSLLSPSSSSTGAYRSGATPPSDAALGNKALLTARWGAGEGELGRSRPQEGNPEGPMSFAEAGDDLLVLDQVNGKVTRFDKKSGQPKSSFKTSLTTQDIAIAKDGTVVLLDRLVEKSIRLVDKSGRAIGTLMLPADRIPDPGLTTGVFVDGKDVYVEKEHGALVRIGGIDGTPTSEPAELTGRPSKDGSLLLMVALAQAEARANLNVFDRKANTLRFARVLSFPRPTRQVVLLDSDAKGTIYVGLIAGKPDMVHVACLDPTDGRVLGRVVLPVNHTQEESFKDFVVMNDGTILSSMRSEDGVSYEQARCP